MNTGRWFLVIPPEGAARTVAQHAADAFLERLGPSDVKIFDTATYRKAFTGMLTVKDKNMVVDLISQSLAVSCLDFGATHCLVGALAPVTLFILLLLRKYSIKTIHWFYEDYHKARYWKTVLDGYDCFFTIQHGEIEALCREKGVAFRYLPTAGACASLPFENKERIYDAAFIGIPSRYRIAVLEHLAENGMHLCIAGSGWDQYHGILEPSIAKKNWVGEEETFQLLLQSRTGINLSLEDPAGRDDIHISPRVYDICAAGCRLVTEDVPLFTEAFPDAESLFFSNPEEALDRISRRTATSTDNADSMINNRNNVLKHHRYVNRVETILQTVSKM
jgi:hypothetical protein